MSYARIHVNTGYHSQIHPAPSYHTMSKISTPAHTSGPILFQETPREPSHRPNKLP